MCVLLAFQAGALVMARRNGAAGPMAG